MSNTTPSRQELVAPTPDKPRLMFLYDGEFSLDNGVSNYMRTIAAYVTDEACAVEYLVGAASDNIYNVRSLSKTIPVHANGSTSRVAVHTPQRQLEATLAEIEPDAVHVQLPFSPFLSGKAIRALPSETKVVGTFHTPMPSGWLKSVNRMNARLTRTTMERFDHLYSVSTTAQAAAKAIYGVDSEVLPCPIDINACRPSAERPSQQTNKTVITFLGRLVERKGLATLLEGMQSLPLGLKDRCSLQIIGDGEDRGALEQYVAANEMDGNTTFFGKVGEEQKYALLASSDIAVYPSRGAESFGVVLLEAMASGGPAVIASDTAGYSEVFKEVPSSLIPAGSSSKIAESIQRLMLHPGQYQNLFEAQQDLVEKFDIRKTVGPTLMKAYGFRDRRTI